MITNAQRKETLKRKRIDIQKKIANNEIEQDKVWLPKEDFTEIDPQPIGKEFIPTSKYNTFKQNANSVNIIMHQSVENAKRIPFKTTAHFNNNEQREFQ